jgi:predicted P-loop ATPase
LEIGGGFQIPWRQLAEERDSMWAAAVAAYSDNLMSSNAGEIAQIAEYIQEFGDPDPWMDKIASYVMIRQEVTAAEVLSNALELDPRQSRQK